MLTFHAVRIDREINRINPLFVGNFFNLKGMWWKKRKQRQNLILSIACAWYGLTKNNSRAPGFIEEEILLTSLTRQVKDARVILDKFFEIIRIGYNFNNGIKSPTLVSPKKLEPQVVSAIHEILHEVKFDPGPAPTKKKLVQSTTKVVCIDRAKIISQLKLLGKTNLIPPVNWLLDQVGEITFYYEPAGKLQARDKSVWPIKSIETWPGWLRHEIFGTVVDLENAYCQFLLSELREKYKLSPHLVELKYPDIVKSDTQKEVFRNYICTKILKLDSSHDNLKIVKRLVMALANGSNISPLMLLNSSGRSEAVNIVLAANQHLSTSDLFEAGKYLGFISKQFKSAQRELCLHLFNSKPTRGNQKKIFQAYLAWERSARYKIWESVGRTGLMLHDGLDGIMCSSNELLLEKQISNRSNLKVSVEA
jgi:hypothetical protein